MDLKDNNSTANKNNIDTEKSTFERLETEVKNTIFSVVFVLLKDDEQSMYSVIVIAAIQFLQVLYFPFHPQIRDIWNADNITSEIENILGFLRLVPYFEETNFNAYIVLFYILWAVIVVVVIDILYINYAFSKKKYAFNWPIIGLRIIISTFTTFLYVPITEYFFSVLNCIDVRGESVHYIFTEEVCWSGVYILHAIMAIIGVIFFNIIALIAVLTFFEYRSNSNDSNSKINSRSNVIFLLYQGILIICFAFMNSSEYQIILLALIIIGSTVSFIKFHFNSPFHNEIVSKVWTCLMAVNLWTAVMIIFARIMENNLFEGSIIAWFIGIPFILLVILTNRDHRIDLLLINVNKFQNGQEIENQIRYILKLISWQQSNRNASILLDGYVEIVKQTCNKDDSAIKFQTQKNNRFQRNIQDNEEGVNEKYAPVMTFLVKLFNHGLKKFPNDTSLRIAYAFFLLDKMQSKQQALQELNNAESSKPPLDEEFIIYRYKKIIEDEIAESQNEGTGGLDVVSEIAFQNHLKSCQANIEKSALLHMEFWSQLSEENPDLGKLNDIGSKINSSIQNVEEHWNKLQKINQHNTRAIRLYGKFVIEILNDKETGEALLEKARTITNGNNNNKMVSMMNTGDDFSSESTPTVWVSGDQEKFGTITNINLAAASLFGYNKTELINRQVKGLMPQAYAKHHDGFIENYLQTQNGVLIGKKKQRFVFGKNKSNYIFPVYLSLSSVPLTMQGVQFVASFRVEKNYRNTAYVLTDENGNIDSISSSCINLLKIDNKYLTQKKPNVQDLIPGAIKDRHNIFQQSGASSKLSAQISFQYPKDSEYLGDTTEASALLNCNLYELTFETIRESGGFYFRFDKPIEKIVGGVSSLEKRAQISNFQFRFERNTTHILGEYVEGTNSDAHSGPEGQGDITGHVLDSDARGFMDMEHSDQRMIMDSRQGGHGGAGFDNQKNDEPKINYGEGIKTMRLQNGRVAEAEVDEDEEWEEENGEDGEGNKKKKQDDSMNKSQQQDESQEGEDINRDLSNAFKSKKVLNAVISDKKPPQAIIYLKWTANLLMAFLLVLAIVDFAISNSQFDDVLVSLNLINMANRRTSELMNVLSKTRDLYLTNIGAYDTADPTTLRDAIEASIDEVQNLKIQLERNSDSLSSAHSTLLNDAVIPLKESPDSDSVDNKGLIQATDQVISKAIEVKNKDLSEITLDNPDYYFVTYNLLNEFYDGLRQSANYYVTELEDSANSKKEIFMAFLILSIVILLVTMVILYPVLKAVNKTREEVLALFLVIPEGTVRSLYGKCENFISNLQVGEDDDLASEFDDEGFGKQQDDDTRSDMPKRNSRRRFKNSGKSQAKFYFQFLIGAVFIEAYFVYNYLMNKGLLDDITDMIIEINSTAVADPFYSFVNNAERQLFIDPTFPVASSDDPFEVSQENIKEMYNLDSEIHQQHSINIKIHSTRYKDFFNDIMMLAPCSLFEDVELATCQLFADGSVDQGMAVALTRHFENMRFLLTQYEKYNVQNPEWDQDPTAFKEIFDANTQNQTNHFYSINRLSQALEVDEMQHVYVVSTFKMLMENLLEGINDDFESHETTRLIIFILFLLLLLIIYIIFWIPLINKLSNDIWRTKSMLTMIPMNVISKIKEVKLFLKKFWSSRGSQE